MQVIEAEEVVTTTLKRADGLEVKLEYRPSEEKYYLWPSEEMDKSICMFWAIKGFSPQKEEFCFFEFCSFEFGIDIETAKRNFATICACIHPSSEFTEVFGLRAAKIINPTDVYYIQELMWDNKTDAVEDTNRITGYFRKKKQALKVMEKFQQKEREESLERERRGVSADFSYTYEIVTLKEEPEEE